MQRRWGESNEIQEMYKQKQEKLASRTMGGEHSKSKEIVSSNTLSKNGKKREKWKNSPFGFDQMEIRDSSSLGDIKGAHEITEAGGRKHVTVMETHSQRTGGSLAAESILFI